MAFKLPRNIFTRLLTYGGNFQGRISVFGSKGKQLPIAVLKSECGWKIYDSPDFPTPSAVGNGSDYTKVVGMGMRDALTYLSTNGFNCAEFQYVSESQLKGTVVGGQELSTTRGNVILVLVSSGN